MLFPPRWFAARTAPRKVPKNEPSVDRVTKNVAASPQHWVDRKTDSQNALRGNFRFERTDFATGLTARKFNDKQN
jgi:hypothetical protein